MGHKRNITEHMTSAEASQVLKEEEG